MNPYLINVLEFGPELTERSLSRIPAAKFDTNTDPERFTPREIIAHLADWEPILLQRMKQTVAHPGCLIEGMDEVQRANDMDYASSDPQERLDYWKIERAGTVAWLKALKPEDWRAAHTHNEKGEMTVADQANMLLGHDLYHLRQLADFED